MKFILKITLILIALFVFFITAPAFSATRVAGKILSFNPQSRIYTIELKDGSKVQIKIKEDGKTLRSDGNESFKIGETAVFSIVSPLPLNDVSLIAESVMDIEYARSISNKYYYTMDRNMLPQRIDCFMFQ